MSHALADISVSIKMNGSHKTAMIHIPWQELSSVSDNEVREWFAKAEKVRKEWEANGVHVLLGHL